MQKYKNNELNNQIIKNYFSFLSFRNSSVPVRGYITIRQGFACLGAVWRRKILRLYSAPIFATIFRNNSSGVVDL